MNQRRLQRTIPVVIGGMILVFIAFLPVTVPTADESGVPLPGLSTITPSANGSDTATTRPIGGLYGNNTAKQQFPAGEERIHSVALFVGTYRRVNHGNLQVAIQTNMAGEWSDVATRIVDKADLTDNAYYTVTFSPPIRVVKGQALQLVLTSAGGSGDAITWWVNTNWQPQGYALFYDDKPQQGTARFRVSYEPDSGRLFQVLGPLWRRLTLFLDPLWQVVLIFGCCVLAASFVVLGRHLTA